MKASKSLFLAVLAAAALAALAVPASAQSRVGVELTWQHAPITPGRSMLGVVLDITDRWHVQAGKGSGDDKPPYIATTVSLTLPDGWVADDPLWPPAHQFVLGTGSFAETLRGYEGRVLIAIPVRVPESAAAGTYDITVEVAYQACDDQVCEMPTSATADGSIDLVTSGASGLIDSPDAALFDETIANNPGAPAEAEPKPIEFDPLPPPPNYEPTPRFGLTNFKFWGALVLVIAAMCWMILRTLQITTRPGYRAVVTVFALTMIGVSSVFVWQMTTSTQLWRHYSEAAFDQARADGKRVLVKFTAGWCANCHVNERIILASEKTVEELMRPDTVAFKVDLTGENEEGERAKEALGGGGIPLIAIYPSDATEPVLIRGPLVGTDAIIKGLEGKSTTASADVHLFDFLGWQFSVGSNATVLVLGLALIAGFFLNFTPCVLPVIPLKILSLQAHAKDPRRCFILGFIFGLGIIAAFAVLGVLIAGFIGGIEKLDWGGMFSYWWFSGILGIIVGVMALGMLGAFAARLPQFVYMFDPRSDTASGSFFMGVFTAVLSTPCTGPLLGATVAWVVLQPKWLAFLTFVVMGVGMALPYVLLTAKPSWLDRMPRTGPGSELVKQVMGLLLLAVAVFFVGVSVHSLAA